MTSTHLRSADEPTPASGAGASFRKPSSGLSRRALVTGAAWSVPAIAFANAAPAQAASCQQGTYSSLARGKFLSGGLFNINLDTLLSVNGTIASTPSYIGELGLLHSGTSGTAHSAPANPETTPPTPLPTPNAPTLGDWHAGPLNVSALGAINVNATGIAATLSQILAGLATAPTGAVNQFASAFSGSSSTISMGGSGAVTNTGTIDLTAAGGAYPDVASIDLKTLLTPLLGGPGATALANIANLQLKVGAVAGRAKIDYTACPMKLHRSYGLAHLLLVLNSGLISGLTTAITPLLNNILNLNLGPGISIRLRSSIITNGADGQTPPDGANPPQPLPAAGPIRLNLATGDATIDLAVLFGGASASPFGSGYQPWLSQREPNTALFIDYPVPAGTITTFLNDLVAGITDRLLKAIQIRVLGTWYTLADQPIVGAVAITALNLLLAPGGAIYVLLQGISNLLAGVFDLLKNVLNIMLNVQNDPAANNDPVTGPGWRPAPGRFTAISAFTPDRYDVAALGLHAVNAPANANDALDLYLGRGSVGRDQLISVP